MQKLLIEYFCTKTCAKVTTTKSLYLFFFTAPFQNPHACIHRKINMYHATEAICLHNMRTQCNMKSALCNTRTVLCIMRSVLYDTGGFWCGCSIWYQNYMLWYEECAMRNGWDMWCGCAMHHGCLMINSVEP